MGKRTTGRLEIFPRVGWFDGSKVVPFDQSRADRTRRYRSKPITRANSTLLFALNLALQIHLAKVHKIAWLTSTPKQIN